MNGIDFEFLLTNTYLQIIAVILVALLLKMIVREFIGRVIKRVVKKHKYNSIKEEKQREDTLIGILARLLTVIIYVTAIVVILYILGINLLALLTAIGAAGLFLGFGAQAAIRNYIAGFFILLENQYRVDDIITVYANGANVSGVVEGVTMRVTRLRDLDGNLIIVQNGDTSPVTNMSLSWANVNVDVGIGYDDDLDLAIAIMNKVGKEQAKDPEFAKNIVEPIEFFRVERFGDNAIILKAIGKVHPATQWATAGDFRYRIKKAFDEAHIDIPLPQVVVNQPRQKTSKHFKHDVKPEKDASKNKSELDDIKDKKLS